MMQVQQVKPGSPARQRQFLTFNLGTDAFGVDILKVREIRQWEAVRAIPDAPEDVRGVLDLRGSIVPIVDLRARLGSPEILYSATTVVIIVMVDFPGLGIRQLGVVVDGVSGVLDVAENDIREAPENVLGISRVGLAGMLSLDAGMVVLLDIDGLFGSSAGDVGCFAHE